MHGQNQQRLNLWCPIIINERLDIKTAHTHNHTHTDENKQHINKYKHMNGMGDRRIEHRCNGTKDWPTTSMHEHTKAWTDGMHSVAHSAYVINRKISQIHTDPHSIGCAISWRVKCPCSVGKWHCCCFCPCKIRYSPCIFPVRTPVIYQMDRGLQKHLQN